MPVPAYLWTIMTWATFAISTALPIGAAAALRAAGAAPQEVRKTVLRMSALLAAWIVAAMALAATPVDETALFPGAKGALVVVIATFFAMLLYRSSRRVSEVVPQSWVIAIQAYRGLGAIFLLIFGLGELPGTFAFPAGFGDWMVGLLAIPVAAIYASGSNGSAARLAVAWNLLGMADLVIAVSMGVLNTPGLHVLPSGGPSNELLVTLPLSMIPFYLVPLSLTLHIVSLAKLGRERRAAIPQPAIA